ncbi:hypothetical protein C2W27_14455 [Salmonella enterica]|nr:hypothetical protein [Salmonella enterica]
MAMNSVLKACLPYVVAGLGCIAVGYTLGGAITAGRTAGEIAGLHQQIADYERGQRLNAEQQNTALAAALEQQTAQQQENERIAGELRQAKRTIDEQARAQKRRISHAVASDSNFNGIGPGGLREYRAAFGYPAELPARPGGAAGAASETASAGTGLSPVDLISHATDYGAYCRSLEAQLIQISQWEASRRDH